MFIECLELALSCLVSIKELFHVLCDVLSPTAITSNANENFFALVRERKCTPDTLEFSILFPNIVGELLKNATVLPFNYYTGNKHCYDQVTGCIKWTDLPQIDKSQSIKRTDEEKALMEDWRRAFVQSVRQITIRQQTTKSKCGTLPIYAYGAKDIIASSDVEFADFLRGTVPDESTIPGRPILLSKDTACLHVVKDSNEVKLILLLDDVKQGQEKS